MFTIKNLQKANGVITIFKNTNISFHKGQKVAIVGPNGSGKSTLAKIIAGIDNDIIVDRTQDNGLSIGYMQQNINLIYDGMMIIDRLTHTTGISTLQESILTLSTDYESHSKFYDFQYELFEKLGGWNFESMARNIMNIFGLEDIHLDRHIYTQLMTEK